MDLELVAIRVFKVQRGALAFVLLPDGGTGVPDTATSTTSQSTSSVNCIANKGSDSKSVAPAQAAILSRLQRRPVPLAVFPVITLPPSDGPLRKPENQTKYKEEEEKALARVGDDAEPSALITFRWVSKEQSTKDS